MLQKKIVQEKLLQQEKNVVFKYLHLKRVSVINRYYHEIDMRWKKKCWVRLTKRDQEEKKMCNKMAKCKNVSDCRTNGKIM